jgi:ribosomal protein L20
MKEIYSVAMDPEIYERVKKSAREKGLSTSRMINMVMAAALESEDEMLKSLERMTFADMVKLIMENKEKVDKKKKPAEDDSTGQP